MSAPPPNDRDSDRERVGTVLHDKWTLERLLGVGGMGAVYAARHRNGAKAAVKIFSPLHPTAQLREKFLREGYAANRVEHAGAVKVLDDDVIDKGPDEGLAYLVMELLEGESLFDRSQREPPLTERDLLEVADGVLAVLEAAHANGVVHRDLKPDNLFLVKATAERNEIKVLDFGLARLLEKQEHSWNGVAFGTPTFMSPEQAAGKVADIDGRTDIYALGAILFQLSSNQRIHDAAHTLGLVVRMATTPAPKLKTVAPSVSDGFAKIVDRALAFDRDLRYQTAAEMRADVRTELAATAGRATSLVNLVSSSSRAPDSARVLPASTESEDAASPAFAYRHTIAAESAPTREVEGPPSARALPAEPSIGERLLAREDEAEAARAAPLVTRKEPAIARAEERASGEAARSSESRRVFSPVVLGIAAVALLGFIAFESRHLFVGRDTAAPPPAPSASSSEAANVPPAPSDSTSEATPLVVELEDAGLDAGEDEDDEDDEDDLEAGAPDGGHHAATPRLAPRPAAKKPPPRRPGAPRRPKKRRWHR